MPYIDPQQRVEIDPIIGKLALEINCTPSHMRGGRLNYAVTKLLHLTLIGEWPNYHDYAEVLGTLEAIKLEIFRRRVGPYEDTKIEANGDVV